MKLRKGFVSNSSSSSFICGIAEIKDKEKFNKYVSDHKIKLDEYDVYVHSAGNDKRWDVNFAKDDVTVESFQTSSSVRRSSSDSAEYFVVNVSNDEGDGPFWNDDYMEYEYDIDLSYFDEDQRKVYGMFFNSESGLNLENSITYGAGRNG